VSQDLKNSGAFPHDDPDDHWWIPSGQTYFSPNPADSAAAEFDLARQHFFLPRRYRDPFGANTTVGFDSHDLLMVETRDALNNRVRVETNDYRVLQPRLVSDPNGNQTEVAFDALGLVVGTAVMGKPAPSPREGDSLAAFKADLTQAEVDGFHDTADPHEPAPALLQGATTRIVYDLDRFQRTQGENPKDLSTGLPPFAATLTREIHICDLLPGESTKIQISFSYSDGFGREIQKKTQAEPGPLFEGGSVVSPRWVGSGWTIFNNKGKPARQYEPFFSRLPEQGHRFEFGVQVGVSPILFYDPVERVVATRHPNHTYEKVVFDPWRQTTYDGNDATWAPDKPGAPPFDPKHDPDVGPYFERLPDREYLPTWHDLRTDAAKALQEWPDTDAQGQPIPSNAKRREAERDAAGKASAHADTPTTAHLDALGRPFLTLAHHKVVCQGHALNGTEDQFATRIELDLEGNQRAVLDERKLKNGDRETRILMRYDYDMLGTRIHQLSMEAGARWMLQDVTGKPIRAWDSRGHSFRTEYDPLRRPQKQFVQGTPGKPGCDPRTLEQDPLLVDLIEYGEGLAYAEALNLRTRIYRHADSASLTTNAILGPKGQPVQAYDFKGNLLGLTRQLVREYAAIPNWQANPQLEGGAYTSATTYDALNRPVTQTTPATPAMTPSILRPTYNEANLLERVDANLRGETEPNGDLKWTPFVTNIDYDAKGQRTLIEYGCGATAGRKEVRTRYDYDPATFRLTHLRTTRGVPTALDCSPRTQPRQCQDSPAHCPGVDSQRCVLQDLSYTYDPVGNITHIQDEAQQTLYFRNKRVEPSADYTYDAIYRLIRATGREHLGQIGTTPQPPTPHSHDDHPRVGLLHPGEGGAMGTYVETYLYDAVGNFDEMKHTRTDDQSNSGWTRTYAYGEASLTEPEIPANDGVPKQPARTSNRLSSTTIGKGDPEPYAYDPHGNMTRMNHLPLMEWDHRDRLLATARQVVKNGEPETTWYVYDASGQRVRKVTVRAAEEGKAPIRKSERVYLGGFEIYREYQGDDEQVALERETLHVMDDKQRIALVETRTLDTAGKDSVPPQLIRYQFGNHLGSASLELDEQAQIISYEEYAPYGGSTYQAVRSQAETAKCYRYSGKERDDSGLYYYGVRYFATWLGTWTSCDPICGKGSDSLYQFSESSPIRYIDPNGKAAWDTVRDNAINVALFYKETARDLASIPIEIARDRIEDACNANNALMQGNIVDAAGYITGINRIVNPLSDKVDLYRDAGASVGETAGLLVGDFSGMNRFMEGATGETYDAKRLSTGERVERLITGGAQVVGTAASVAAPIAAAASEIKIARALSLESKTTVIIENLSPKISQIRPQEGATPRGGRSKKPRADLMRRSAEDIGKQARDTNLPKWVRGHFKNEIRRTGSTSPYKWRVPGAGHNNPSGLLQAGHQHGSPFFTSGESGGPLKWEWQADNLKNAAFETGKQPRIVRPLPR